MRKKLFVMLSMLCLIFLNSVAVSANEISIVNERKDKLAYEFFVPALIIGVTIGGLILSGYIKRKRDNRDNLF